MRENDVEIAIKITNRCEKMCQHCCERSVPNGKSMPFEKLDKILKEVSKIANVVGFTGGEPVLYKDSNHTFIDVIDLCVKYKLYPTTMIGGAYDNKEYRNIFDNIWAKPFAVSFNLFKKDWKELFLTAVRLIQKNNQVAVILVSYTDDKNNKEKVLKKFYALERKYKLTLPIPECGEITHMGRARNIKHKDRIKYGCELQGNKDYLYIDLDGHVLPCCGIIPEFLLLRQGWKPNLMATKNLKQIWQKSRYFCKNICKYENN